MSRPPDPLLDRLKAGRWADVPHISAGSVASCLGSLAGGVLLAAGTFQPWQWIDGVTSRAIAEGAEGGSLPTLLLVCGALFSLIALFALVQPWFRRPRRPRFTHWAAIAPCLLLAVLVGNEFHRIERLTGLYVATNHPAGRTGTGDGFTYLLAGLLLLVASPLLSVPQVVRTLRH